jgi:NAD(P)-dependent dehydrogenase (short-subunit alcohol dehydrogenase family)
MAALAGRVALVTGGGRGIGRATALALAERGADVAVMSRSVPELEETAALVRASGRRSLAVVGNVAHGAAVHKAVTVARDALARSTSWSITPPCCSRSDRPSRWTLKPGAGCLRST